MDIVARTLEMVDPLVATEGGIARIACPGMVPGGFRFLRPWDVVLILVVGVGGIIQTRVRRGAAAEARVPTTSAKIGALAHPER